MSINPEPSVGTKMEPPALLQNPLVTQMHVLPIKNYNVDKNL